MRYNFQEPAFMENTPGGLRSTYQETREALEKSGYGWNKGFDRRFVNHAFIPSLSGAGLLDVDINNNQSWYANIDTTTVKGIFDEVRAPVRNQGHVTITRENKQWFLDLIHTWGPQEKPLFAITQITNSMDGFTRNPSINSDGTRIAFASDRDLTGGNAEPNPNSEIFLFDTTTNTFTQITNSIGRRLGIGNNAFPSINSDGTRIAFESDNDLTGGNAEPNPNREIFLFDTTTNTFTQITNSTGGNGNIQPSINPDGTRIAFESDRDLTGGNADLNFEIFLFDTTTNTLTQITDSTGGDGNFWTSINSNGTHIAFQSNKDLTGGNAEPNPNREIFLFDTTTNTFTQITNSTGGNGNIQPSINPDGTRIAFMSDRDLTTGGNTDLNFEIFLFDTTTNKLTQVTFSTGGINEEPLINSNGTYIAFISNRDLDLTRGNSDLNQELFLAVPASP